MRYQLSRGCCESVQVLVLVQSKTDSEVESHFVVEYHRALDSTAFSRAEAESNVPEIAELG
jgi:hypothetical protein